MEDACADASTLTSYDAVISAEDVPWRIEAEISQSQDGAISIVSRTYDSSDSARSLSASSGVTLESERVYIFDAPPRPTPANSREAATTPQAVDVGVTAYGRRMENGEWTAWEVGRTSRGTMESDPGNIFCGEILSQFATFRYNGQEQINGIQTRKYTGTIEMPEPVWGNYRFEYWVGPNGRIVRNDRTNLSNNATVTATFSNWGEVNVVTAPVQETPTP